MMSLIMRDKNKNKFFNNIFIQTIKELAKEGNFFMFLFWINYYRNNYLGH